MDYQQLAYDIAVQEGIDPDLFTRLVQAESSFNPNARSEAGAIGLAQLMPGTASDLGVDPSDPEQNLRGGARFLRQQLDTFGDTTLALAAYNAGPGNVRKYGGIPPFEETQNYVQRVMGGEQQPRGIPSRREGQQGTQQGAQPQQQAPTDFAQGFAPPQNVYDLYRRSQASIDPLSLYNAQAIADMGFAR
tara:strand:+ start:2448 stop:3017 length:570 start_codon:yes stop_codon:yes gene_type:complete